MEKDKNQEKDVIEELLDDIEDEETPQKGEDSPEDETESLKKQLQEANDRVLRASAELDNFRKRLTKETDDKLKYSNQVLMSEMLPVIDNLELAVGHIKDDNGESQVGALKQGVEITLKQMKETLAKFGLKEIQAEEGDKFDPQYHEALAMDDRDDLENNAISLVMQKGYTLHDRVVRPAKVKVNKKQ